MLALGMVFVVVIRDIDLSIGWMFNFSAVIAAKAMVLGVDPWLAAGIGIAFGGLLGLINGVLAVWLRIPVIIITLGTLSAYRGLSLVVNESRAVVPAGQVRARSSPSSTSRSSGSSRCVAILFLIAGGRPARAAPPHPLRLPRPGHGQQPRGGPARRHPGRPHADPGPRADGRHVRPDRRDVPRLPRGHRPGHRRRLPAAGRGRRDHRRHAAVRAAGGPSSAPSSAP